MVFDKDDRRMHVLFGPDGSRRYAEKEGVGFLEAYKRTSSVVTNVVEWCFEDFHCVDELTLWTLQEYNIDREPTHIEPLMNVIIPSIGMLCASDYVQRHGLQVRLVGELERLFEFGGIEDGLLQKLTQPVRPDSGKILNILFAYNGSKELRRAYQRCVTEGVEPTMENMSARWSISPVSLFIRTGQPPGFNNLSDIYPGIDRARLTSTPAYPPDLTRQEMRRMISAFLGLKDSYSRVTERGR